jgi:phosphoglucomutase
MSTHLLEGKPASKDLLINVSQLEAAFYEAKPDPGDSNQLVSFGTSGHRGTSSNATFTEAHILAVTQAICEYRRTQGITGPLLMGKDTHALSPSAGRVALEVLAANGGRYSFSATTASHPLRSFHGPF